MLAGHRFETSWFWRVLPSGMRRRWWLFRLFDIIARNWPVMGERKGALIIRMDGIGDMVLFRRSLDHYAELLELQPEDITILGCKSWGPIAEDIFSGFQLLMIDEHAFARQPLYRFKISLFARRTKAKITICDSYFRRAMMADSLVWVAAAPSSVVSLPFINEATRVEFTYYLSQVDRIIDTGPYPTHEIDRHTRFLSELAGHIIQPEAPQIPWREISPAIAEGGAYAVLNPGSNEYGRRWPFESYLDIAEKLLAEGLRVIIVGGPGESSGDHRARFGNDARVTDLTGSTGLAELLDILKGAAVVISNDTGPAHLAIALGAPTVVIVGGGHFGSFVPYPENVCPKNARFVFEEMPCYHCFWRCHLRQTRYDVFPCVAEITVDAVWREAEDILA
ncbi:MAG: glycosyltransferase family 9 protein [Rhodospirillales bacterium]|nr:glycosyltransferase family 9 protein [Rhodospirillales bacterium]